jgi:ABC-type thiamin/hydroxymethylpyrimidine transport system permease subunit
MGLKSFHVFFIVVSTLCALAFAAWAVLDWTRTQRVGTLALGVLAFAAAGALVFYGLWFLRKLRGVGT